MKVTITNHSSKDLDQLPKGCTLIGSTTITFQGERIVAPLWNLGLMSLVNNYCESLISTKGDRKHIAIYDRGFTPANENIPVPNYEMLVARTGTIHQVA